MTTKADFLTSEWKQLLNAPHWVYLAMTEGDRGNFVTRRQEAKALNDFLGDYDPSTRLIKNMLAEQKDADDVSGSYDDAKKALESIGRLIDSKATEKEEAAIRGFLLDAAEAIAEEVIEKRQIKLVGSPDATSDHEKKAMAMIEKALKSEGRSSLRGTRRGTSRSKRRSSSSSSSSSMADAIKKQVQGPATKPEPKSSKAESQRSAVQKRAAERKAEKESAEAKREEVRKRAAERKARKEAEAKERQAEEARQKAKAQAAKEKRQKEVEARQKAAADRRKKAEDAKRADLDQKRKEAAQRRKAVGARRSKPVQQDAPAPAPSPASALQTYVVKPGDTLSHISLHFYGTANRWKDIFEANRGILNNPNVIIPGQELTIPA